MTTIGEPGMTNVKRRKILLSAFACDPVTGSEPYVGWNWAMALSQHHDVVVLTRTYSAKLIDCYGKVPPFEIISFDLPWCSTKNHYWRLIKTYYFLWQLFAPLFVLYKSQVRKFDYIQHLTYNVIDLPGFLWLIPRVKFIWGPVGGGQVPPSSLRRVYGAGWKKQRLRALIKASARFNPLIRCAIAKASHVFFANSETAHLVAHFCASSSTLLETAIEPGEASPKPPRDGLQLLWLGNVIDRKALMIAIDALAAVLKAEPSAPVTLKVAGDGPLLSHARIQARNLGVDKHVLFLGRVPFEDVSQLMREADVFLFTSVQDTSGNVILEAMAEGTPVIGLDHQGARSIIDHTCGVPIRVGSYEQTTLRIRDAIRVFLTKPSAAETLGKEARKVVLTKHSWAARMSHYNEVINEAV